MKSRFFKVEEADEERLDDELILLHRRTLQMRLLNESAAVLWDALGESSTAEELADLVAEARPEIAPAESLAYATAFLVDLAEAGFLIREERGG